jgi:hypothetical protein
LFKQDKYIAMKSWEAEKKIITRELIT